MENKTTTTAKVIPKHHHHVFSSNRSVTSIRSETRGITTASSYYSAANNNNNRVTTTSSASSVRSTARRVNNASTPPRIKSTGGHYYNNNNNTKNPTRTDGNDDNAATNDFSIGLYCLANMMRNNTDDDNVTCYKGSCHCGAIQFELLLPTNNNNSSNDYSKKEEGGQEEEEEENKKDATTTTTADSTTTTADADIVIQRSTERDAERDKIWYRYIKVKITHLEITQGQDSLTTYYHVKETLMAPRPKTRYYIPTKTTTQAGCARAFCKHCGVFILYAPNKNSPVMHINANCIPALNNNNNDGPTSSSSRFPFATATATTTTLITTTARNKIDLYVSTACKHWKELVQAGQTASTEVTSVVTNAAIEIREMIILSVLKGLKTWKSILDEE
eukprot:scaffold1086_cov66-Cylindrotheca_fusiformis.AAC.3